MSFRGGLNSESSPAPQSRVASHYTEVEFIDSRERLLDLEEKWRTLYLLDRDCTPFQSPDWLLPWWNHYGNERLFSFAFWHGSDLAGLAPLYLFCKSPNEDRRLVFIGTGNSDYLDMLLQPELASQCCDALMAELQRRYTDWDTCDFQRLRRTSPLVRHAGTFGFSDGIARDEPCPTLDLRHSFLHRPMLKRVRQSSRQMTRAHALSFELATQDRVDDLFSAFEHLHSSR